MAFRSLFIAFVPSSISPVSSGSPLLFIPKNRSRDLFCSGQKFFQERALIGNNIGGTLYYWSSVTVICTIHKQHTGVILLLLWVCIWLCIWHHLDLNFMERKKNVKKREKFDFNTNIQTKIPGNNRWRLQLKSALTNGHQSHTQPKLLDRKGMSYICILVWLVLMDTLHCTGEQLQN